MVDIERADRPDVPVPAPIIMGLCLLVAVLLEWMLPVFDDSPLYALILGWSLQVLGALILLWCFLIFIRKRTTIMPANPVNYLVDSGPYKYSRNPMYLSLLLIHLGISVSTSNLWGLFMTVVFLVLIRIYVINPEEKYLTKHFGESYRDYSQRVSRWIGYRK